MRGTTEAINLVAQSYGRTLLEPGDEVLISRMEHHSNIVPWQMLCEQTGATLRVAPINDDGELIAGRVRAAAVGRGPRSSRSRTSPTRSAPSTRSSEIVELAHARGVPVLIDGAQAVPHLPVDVQELDCDFYAFSGHKIYGPTGIGVLYGRARAARAHAALPGRRRHDPVGHLREDRPTTTCRTSSRRARRTSPARRAGRGDRLSSVDRAAIAAHEDARLAVTRESSRSPLRIIGPARYHSGVISFTLDGVHPHDVGTILDHDGICVRAGHHCAQPIMERFGVPATVRASFAIYNRPWMSMRSSPVLHKVREVFA